MRTIEVRSSRVDFPNTLGAMRQWLDGHKRPLARFETEGEIDAITIKVQFEANDLAEEFRQSFEGWYSG
jgi:hypothetical protein